MQDRLASTVDYILNRPLMRKVLWKRFYNYVGKFALDEMKFFNHGMMFSEDEQQALKLAQCDEADRLFIQLYYHLLSQVKLSSRSLLEVGCGRGGGLYFANQYLDCERLTGVDLCRPIIERNKKIYQHHDIEFIVADAVDLPFSDNEFDIILNVESSHCYSSMSQFLNEVKRVLKPGGHFLFSDLRSKEEMVTLDKMLTQHFPHRLSQQDITDRVTPALRQESERKNYYIQKNSPKVLSAIFREIFIVEGSRTYQCFQNGDFVFYSYVFKV